MRRVDKVITKRPRGALLRSAASLRLLSAFLAVCCISLSFPSRVQAVPAGTVISNTANIAFDVGGVPANLSSNPVDITATGNGGGGGATPGVLLTKTAGKTSVSIGDVLEYRLRFDNTGSGLNLTNVRVTDNLPPGLRYKAGTAKIDGAATANPALSRNGRTLVFDLGDVADGAVVEIRYVAEVIPGARGEKLVNTASASADGGVSSNATEASVRLTQDFFNSEAFLEGRVLVDSCDPNSDKGLKGVRIYLENGTYAITDEEGRWHMEGVKPGTHIVQLDKVTLPEEYEIVMCEDHTRHADTHFSQFVDVQGGTLWRADFYVRSRPDKAFFAPLKRMNFGFDEDQMRAEDEDLVRQIARHVLGSDTRITVDGHTDDIGPALYNDDLSRRRAETIRNKLREYGVPDDQIDLQAFGLTHPAADNTLRDGRAINRRVDVSKHSKTYDPVQRAAEKIAEAEQTYWSGFDSAWLEKQDNTLAWVYPDEKVNPATPTVRVGVKHRADYKVNLFINGEAVSALNYDGADKNRAGSVAISRWRGVDLKDSNNVLEAVMVNRSGREIGRISRVVHFSGEAVRAELVPEKSRLLADGKTTPLVAVRLFDHEGYPARPGSVGYFTVNAPYRSEESVEDQVDGRLIRSSRDSRFLVGQDGLALLKLQPTSQSGEAVVTIQLSTDSKTRKDAAVLHAWLNPGKREWIFSGLAEATTGDRDNSGDQAGLDAAELDDGSWDENRAAFFAKGSLDDDWLLTAAYDTDKSEDERFRGVIDPDTYFSLYGDDTAQDYDAASTEKLYLKLETRNFYSMFGDYDTGLDETELGHYNRSATGIKTELKDSRWRANLFATETGQAYLRDEIRGDGTSGLYHLSRKDILVNSDKIIIEVRDRFRNAQILSTETMTRHIDYNIDYDSGTLYFRKPIPANDNRQNPVYIVAEYESEGSDDEEVSGGGRAAYHFSEDTYIGVSGIHEGNTGAVGDLSAVDASFELTENVILKTEYASSDRESGGTDLDGNAYLVEITHEGEKLDASLYTREQEAGFGLNQQNAGQSGVQSTGLDARYHLSNEHTVDSRLYQEKDLVNDAQRDVAEITYNYEHDENLAYVGTRRAQDEYNSGEQYDSSQLLFGGSTALLDKKLTLSLDSELLMNGGDEESSDYPNLVQLGANYRLTEWVDLLMAQEFSWSDEENYQGSSAGFRLRPWTGMETLTEVGQQTGEYGDRTYANMGLTQAVDLNDAWRLDMNIDRSQTISQSNTLYPVASFNEDDTEDFTAYSLGLGYITEVREWTTRVENRHADSEEKTNLYMGYLQEIHKGLSMSLGMALSDSDGNNGETYNSGDIRYSIAFRPNRSAWHHFNRLDYKWDEESDGIDGFRNRRWVNNLISNYKPDLVNQLSLQYGGKYSLDNIEDEEFSGYTDLYGMEYRRNLGRWKKINWDIGTHAHTHNQWDVDIHQYSYGISLGFSPGNNIWVSIGYNFDGFSDDDFSGADYTADGVYLKFRMKADQESLRDLWAKN